MADPIAVISLVEGSIGLVLQCGSVAKTLSDMIAKFKHAEIAILSLVQEVETIQYAWSRIKDWSENHAEAVTDSQLVVRLERSLECGTLVLSALEQDLTDYKHRTDNVNFVLRSKMAWNERAFLDHQHRVRGQVHAMTLLLQVSQLSTSKEQTKVLKLKEKAFRASDESAFSIVPSRMSSHMSVSTRSRDSILTIESQELVYCPLSFEDELFTTRVYKRNYRNPLINSLVKLHWGKKREERRVPTANPEASDDGDSFLSSSTGTITPIGTSVDVSQPWPRNREISLPLRSEGSVPYFWQDSQGIGSGPQYETKESSIEPIYPVEGQPDISVATRPAPRQFTKADNEPNDSLSEAIDNGDLKEVKTLINEGAQVNPRYSSRMPPLHLAICKHDISMTKLLLVEGANCAEEWCGTPPIHQACKNGDYKVTQLLLDSGASANSVDAQQEQPLHAMLSTKVPIPDVSNLIGLLVSRGADINARTRTDRTPLHLSCEHHNVNNVRALLAHGADTNAQDKVGNTPFHILVTAWCEWSDSCESLLIIQLLLQHGVNVDAQDGDGDTPLHILVTKRPIYEAAIQPLLEHGVNVNAQNKVGHTPLHILLTAALIGGSFWIQKDLPVFNSLIQYGAWLNKQNVAGHTLLHIFAERHDVEKEVEQETQLIRLLLDAGADRSVNVQNVAGDTAIHILARRNDLVDKNAEWRYQLIRLLLDAGADRSVNVQNVAGDTPLHILARRIDLVDKNAEWGHQLIRWLLDAGANLSIENLKRESAWQLLGDVKDGSILALTRAQRVEKQAANRKAIYLSS